MKYIHGNLCPASRARAGACWCRKDRGYGMQGALKRGDLVTIFDDFTITRPDVVMRGGDVARFIDFTNMGFNGIVATLEFEGKRLHSVDAGMLIKADHGVSYRRAVMNEYQRRIDAAHAAVRHAQEWADEHGLPQDDIAKVRD